jgi:hypothetical protein
VVAVQAVPIVLETKLDRFVAKMIKHSVVVLATVLIVKDIMPIPLAVLLSEVATLLLKMRVFAATILLQTLGKSALPTLLAAEVYLVMPTL